jgi:dipeptidyl-peptidase 4
MKYLFLYFLAFSSFCIHAQSLTLENIFLTNEYREKRPDNLRFMNDDRFYNEQIENAIIKKETNSGRTIDTLVSKTDTINRKRFELFDYSFSDDEKHLLLAGNRKGIYRRSFKADYVLVQSSKYLVQSSNTNYEQVTINGVSYATFSPDGKKIGYVRDNNLFYYDIQGRVTEQITFDGKKNSIINGSTDWVYEEEFEFTKAFCWSPDSRFLAFYRFDETEVSEYNMQKWEGIYPTDYRFKYPKAGEKNAKVEIKMFDLSSKQTNTLVLDSIKAHYVPRIQFVGNKLLLSNLNRRQDLLSYQFYDPKKNKIEGIYGEMSYPVEVSAEVFSLGKSNFLTTSEKEGANKMLLALYPESKTCVFCGGQYETNYLEDLLSVDTINKWIYYISSKNATDKLVERMSMKTKKKELLSPTFGRNEIQVSEAGNYYIITNTSAGNPATVILYDSKTMKPIRVLEDNASLKQNLKNLNLPEQKFFQFTTAENVQLNGWMIKPKDFDGTKKYPVIMFEYGGPGSQMVVNGWMGNYYLWHQFLASQGFVVACVDGRGTGGRGTAFRTCTYKRLGELETKDQIEAAKYLGSLPYVDKTRIGIWGWSFGGYLSTLSILLGNDVFKAAIAVAPVTNWRFYDTIYTERYLTTPQDNAKGYDLNSPIMYADRLKGDYLLIHGTSDDNVHFQNTLTMQEALIKAGKQFDTFVYPNKAHGISGGKTRLHLYTLMLNFWKTKLKP